jgi:hypothetical protein
MPSSHHRGRHHRHHRQRNHFHHQDPHLSYPGREPSMLSMGLSLLLLAVTTGGILTALYARTVSMNWGTFQKVATRYSPGSEIRVIDESIMNVSIYAGAVVFLASTIFAAVGLHQRFMPGAATAEVRPNRGRRRPRRRIAPADLPERAGAPERCQRCQASPVSNWTFIGDDREARLKYLCSRCLAELLDDHESANMRP